MNLHDAERTRDAKVVRIAEAGGLELKRQGGRLFARCPFHAERTPSFTVNLALESFYCFGCSVSGGYVDLATRLGVNLDIALGPLPPPAPRTSTSARVEPEQPRRLDRVQIVALWSACQPVTSDAGVAAWIASRGIDPADVEDRDLCRALPADADLPWWASFDKTPWNRRSEEYRAIFPLFSSSGRLEGLRARALMPDPDSKRKALAPIGGGASGLVLADDLGRRVLAGHDDAIAYAHRLSPDVALVIAEGEPDFLKWSTNWSDSAERVPAIWGVVAGSWRADFAARVPDGITALIATHRDEAGDRYAAAIVATLEDRANAGRVHLRRWRPKVRP